MYSIHIIWCFFPFLFPFPPHPLSPLVGSLTSTLSTRYVSACEGHTAHLSCPPPTLITVQYAKYGRSLPSSKMCGITETDHDLASRPKNTRWPSSLRNLLLQSSTTAPRIPEDTRCVAVRSLEVSRSCFSEGRIKRGCLTLNGMLSSFGNISLEGLKLSKYFILYAVDNLLCYCNLRNSQLPLFTLRHQQT